MNFPKKKTFRPRVPGGNVAVAFGWQPAADGGVTVGYTITIQGPDGSTLSVDPLPADAASFVKVLPDDTQTYLAVLTAFNAAGTPCANPSQVLFVPHTEPTPPPLPGDPVGFGVTSITDA